LNRLLSNNPEEKVSAFDKVSFLPPVHKGSSKKQAEMFQREKEKKQVKGNFM
jgi:hypothetical protein